MLSGKPGSCRFPARAGSFRDRRHASCRMSAGCMPVKHAVMRAHVCGQDVSRIKDAKTGPAGPRRRRRTYRTGTTAETADLTQQNQEDVTQCDHLQRSAFACQHEPCHGPALFEGPASRARSRLDGTGLLTPSHQFVPMNRTLPIRDPRGTGAKRTARSSKPNANHTHLRTYQRSPRWIISSPDYRKSKVVVNP